MSLAKVQRRKARKDYVCEVGKEPIHPGDEYLWFKVGFRSRFKHIRCLKHPPKPSERESSNLATVYAAQETAVAELHSLEQSEDHDVEQINSIMETYAEAVREVADQYREADDNFGGSGATQSAERADILESSADDLENFSSNELESETVDTNTDPDSDDGQDPEEQDNWEDLIQEAIQAVEETELP
jgi:hypothetical protein